MENSAPMDLIVVLWKVSAPMDLMVVLWKVSAPMDLIVVLWKIFLDLTKSYGTSRRLNRVMCLFGVIPLIDFIFFCASSFL